MAFPPAPLGMSLPAFLSALSRVMQGSASEELRRWASDYRESGREERWEGGVREDQVLKEVCGKEEESGKIAAKWDSEEISRKA